MVECSFNLIDKTEKIFFFLYGQGMGVFSLPKIHMFDLVGVTVDTPEYMYTVYMEGYSTILIKWKWASV